MTQHVVSYRAWRTVNIAGIAVHEVNFTQTLALIDTWVKADPPQGVCHQICTINPEFVVDASRDPSFAALLQRADLRVADGVGILWAAHLLGQSLPERVTGSDGIYRVCEQAAKGGWRVYFLGAAPGVAEKTAQILQQCYPGLVVAGAYSGSPQQADWPEIQQRLTVARTDILFVAYGHPRQDFWIDQHRAELPVKVAIGVGGAFDFVAGVTRRAPRWLQRLGLEWLHRLIREPWRWRRMVKLPVFVGLILKQWWDGKSITNKND